MKRRIAVRIVPLRIEIHALVSYEQCTSTDPLIRRRKGAIIKNANAKILSRNENTFSKFFGN